MQKLSERFREYFRVNEEFASGLEAEILAALRKVEEDEWLDITSAPKWEDDVLVIVCGGRYVEPDVVTADGDYWRANIQTVKAIPTHWRPLPAKPEANSPNYAQGDGQ